MPLTRKTYISAPARTIGPTYFNVIYDIFEECIDKTDECKYSPTARFHNVDIRYIFETPQQLAGFRVIIRKNKFVRYSEDKLQEIREYFKFIVNILSDKTSFINQRVQKQIDNIPYTEIKDKIQSMLDTCVKNTQDFVKRYNIISAENITKLTKQNIYKIVRKMKENDAIAINFQYWFDVYLLSRVFRKYNQTVKYSRPSFNNIVYAGAGHISQYVYDLKLLGFIVDYKSSNYDPWALGAKNKKPMNEIEKRKMEGKFSNFQCLYNTLGEYVEGYFDDITDVLKEIYGIIEKIGQGASGMVYHVKNKTQNLAVKTFNLSDEDTMYDRPIILSSFISEHNSSVYLNNPKLIDRVVKANKSYIITYSAKNIINFRYGIIEYDYIENTLPWKEYTLNHLYYLYNTLDTMHNLGIYYNDFKRDNSIAVDNTRALLIDFGDVNYKNCDKYKNITSSSTNDDEDFNITATTAIIKIMAMARKSFIDGKKLTKLPPYLLYPNIDYDNLSLAITFFKEDIKYLAGIVTNDALITNILYKIKFINDINALSNISAIL